MASEWQDGEGPDEAQVIGGDEVLLRWGDLPEDVLPDVALTRLHKLRGRLLSGLKERKLHPDGAAHGLKGARQTGQAPAALSLGLPRQEGSFARGRGSKGPSDQSAKARFSSPAISSSTAFATSKYSQSIRKPCIMPSTRRERTVLPASTSFAA